MENFEINLYCVLDPTEIGGYLPVLITGKSRSGVFLGYISGVDIEGICSGQPNKKLIAKSDIEQISIGMILIFLHAYVRIV